MGAMWSVSALTMYWSGPMAPIWLGRQDPCPSSRRRHSCQGHVLRHPRQQGGWGSPEGCHEVSWVEDGDPCTCSRATILAVGSVDAPACSQGQQKR